MASGWQLAQSGPEAYQRFIASTLFEGWAHRLASVAAIGADDFVVDLACGTGVVARAVASRGAARVVGIDLNEGMLNVARSIPSAAPIEWVQSDASALQIDDRAVDVLVCQQGLQYFADRPGAVREMRRVLAPGGRAVLTIWRSLPFQPFFRILVETLDRYLPFDVVQLQRAAFALGDLTELRSLFSDAGFDHTEIHIDIEAIDVPDLETFVLGFLSATPMAPAVASLETTARTTLAAHVTDALAGYRSDDGVTFPTEAHRVLALP